MKPRDADVVASELDEDVTPSDDGRPPATISESLGEVHGAGGPFDEDSDSGRRDRDAEMPHAVADAAVAAAVRPFEALPPLPPDLNEAFELFKLAILNHKVSGWREIARDDVLAVLESLRQLALAPAE